MAGETYEVLVVGGGPAGLSAALYLARYDRRLALFDTGHGRSTWHQVNHNYLGFPSGVEARTLRELGRAQLSEYPHVTCIEHKVERLRQDGDVFVAEGQAGEWRGQSVILCTGVVDHYPHFDNWDEYVGRTVHWCITCDGYAVKGSRVVVCGNDDSAASETMQLLRFTRDLTLLTDTHENCNISQKFRDRLAHAGVPVICDKIAAVDGQDGHLRALQTVGGQRIPLDHMFSIQGATPQNKLATDLGVALSHSGYINVDTEQKTNVPGVFAAGDGTRLHAPPDQYRRP